MARFKGNVMDLGRRKFFKSIAVTACAGALSITPVMTGKWTPDSKTAFRFMCDCGDSVIAPVPEKPGTDVVAACQKKGCGRKYNLTWNGDCFTLH